MLDIFLTINFIDAVENWDCYMDFMWSLYNRRWGCGAAAWTGCEWGPGRAEAQ